MKSGLSAARALGFYLLFGCSFISLALAHGENEASGRHGDTNKTTEGVEEAPTNYFLLAHHVGLIYTHIALMTIAWVIILPVAVMLSISASRYTLFTQVTFIATNAFGMLIAVFYNARTPDLYPNNAHHKIGWIITVVVSAHVAVGVIARRTLPRHAFSSKGESNEPTFMPLMTTSEGEGYADESQEFRPSSERSHSPADYRSSLGDNSDTTQVEPSDDESGLPTIRKFRYARHRGRFSAILNFLETLRWSTNSQSLFLCLSYAYNTTDRIILPFGFIAFATGIATFGRFFEGHAIYSGLAHWIKGGVFFWLGLLSLGRWAGSFADLGWAWNVRPPRLSSKTPPSAEFVESFLIFFYGSTNIFLEHLGNSDGEWKAQDLEHLAITVLFIGGGLCGMLVESTSVRSLLNAALHVSNSDEAHSHQDMKQSHAPASYATSLNPIPALVICLLGVMMGSHHQASMTSTMIHKQWANLLLGASLARCLTYFLVYIRPPTSMLPARPPTELLASFGLIAGGIVFMASSKDTVKGMIRLELDAMFLYTVTMGLVGILMAWEVAVLAIKGLAVRKESSYAFRRGSF